MISAAVQGNAAAEGERLGQKIIEGPGGCFFEQGGYEIESLLTKQ